MRRKLPQIEIESPCSENWNEMRGDTRSRFCEACGKFVHNLAEMTPREVDRLTLRVAMGDAVCARASYCDGELVTLEGERPARASLATAATLSAVMAAAVPMAAQNVTLPTDTAVLTGTVVNGDGHPAFVPSSMVFLKNGAATRFAIVRNDGTFEVHAPPGTYEISMTGMEFEEHAATLHEGVQSLGSVVAGPKMIWMTSGGAIAVRLGPMYWARHPLAYARYLGRRFRNSFSS